MPMKVGVPREIFPGERRVALVPGVVPSLAKVGVEVLVEAGAGKEAGYSDSHPLSFELRYNPGEVHTKLAVAIAAAWKNLTFTNDPIASSLRSSAKHAEDVGLLDKVDLAGIYDLNLLNEVLKAKGETPVKSS